MGEPRVNSADRDHGAGVRFLIDTNILLHANVLVHHLADPI
jgi:hypothetical protein